MPSPGEGGKAAGSKGFLLRVNFFFALTNPRSHSFSLQKQCDPVFSFSSTYKSNFILPAPEEQQHQPASILSADVQVQTCGNSSQHRGTINGQMVSLPQVSAFKPYEGLPLALQVVSALWALRLVNIVICAVH